MAEKTGWEESAAPAQPGKKTPEERRKARELKRAEIEKEIRARNDEQREDVEDLVDERGLNPLEIVVIATDAGVVACHKASPAEVSRFMRAVNQTARPGGRAKPRDSAEDTKAFVRSARLYPELEAFEAILREYPVVWETLGSGLADLAGAAFEADVRKN